jgi:aryl-alcohol dehydrogenase-like predicted oxidoreductase
MIGQALHRRLGLRGPQVSALGMGCWAIGGPYVDGGSLTGWGAIDDGESVRALRRAFELGVTFFDTADMYGCGHSERVLARALANVRDEVTIATKVGVTFDEVSRAVTGESGDPAYIRRACEQSLRRLETDYIDLYQFHLGAYELQRAHDVLAVFEELVEDGKVRAIGWSTDDPKRAALFAKSRYCTAIQQGFNVLGGNEEVLELCVEQGLASIVRGPLAMGFLSGKYNADSRFPEDDVRRWFSSADGAPVLRDWLQALDRLREVLTADGRTLAQGALGWLWARSEAFVPIPGFRSTAQVEENAGAMGYGALTPEQMRQVGEVLTELS